MKSSNDAEPPAPDCDHGKSIALRQAVEACQANAAFLADLRAIYADLDALCAQSGAVCLGGGTCCRFDLAGHRLYVSTGELALLTTIPPPAPQRSLQKRCPYQVITRCEARGERPLGCRIFFCGFFENLIPATWYEAFHGRIRRLHRTYCMPYTYTELTSSLLQFYIRK